MKYIDGLCWSLATGGQVDIKGISFIVQVKSEKTMTL